MYEGKIVSVPKHYAIIRIKNVWGKAPRILDPRLYPRGVSTSIHLKINTSDLVGS